MHTAQQGKSAECGAKVRNCGGKCEVCGFRGERNIRHNGKCPQCEGVMRCVRPSVTGANRCRTHGGNSRGAGPGHHRYKHGGASKLNVPMGIEAKARAAMDDPELMDLRFDAALLNEIIKEVLTGDRAVGVTVLKETFSNLNAAMKSGDFGAARDLLIVLGSQIEAAAAGEGRLKKVEQLVSRRTHTVATERRLQIQAGVMISSIAVSHMMSRFVQLVIENSAGCAVCGGRTIKAVRDEYEMLVGPANDQ